MLYLNKKMPYNLLIYKPLSSFFMIPLGGDKLSQSLEGRGSDFFTYKS